MVYNLTNLTAGNATTFSSFAQAVSYNILGGYFIGWIIMIIVFAIFFLAMKTKGYFTSTALAVGCWMVTITALLLRPMGLIGDWSWWIGIILTPIAIFILFMASSKD